MPPEPEPIRYSVVYNTFAQNENTEYSSLRYIWYCKDLGTYYITATQPDNTIDNISTLDKLYNPVALSIYSRLACKIEYDNSIWKFTLK